MQTTEDKDTNTWAEQLAGLAVIGAISDWGTLKNREIVEGLKYRLETDEDLSNGFGEALAVLRNHFLERHYDGAKFVLSSSEEDEIKALVSAAVSAERGRGKGTFDKALKLHDNHPIWTKNGLDQMVQEQSGYRMQRSELLKKARKAVETGELVGGLITLDSKINPKEVAKSWRASVRGFVSRTQCQDKWKLQSGRLCPARTYASCPSEFEKVKATLGTILDTLRLIRFANERLEEAGVANPMSEFDLIDTVTEVKSLRLKRRLLQQKLQELYRRLEAALIKEEESVERRARRAEVERLGTSIAVGRNLLNIFSKTDLSKHPEAALVLLRAFVKESDRITDLLPAVAPSDRDFGEEIQVGLDVLSDRFGKLLNGESLNDLEVTTDIVRAITAGEKG